MINVIQGDITQQKADAIVNAANSSLLGGGGVDGAIHRVGGPDILEACKKIRATHGECKTGEAVITTAGKLPAKFVIHTVGPIWGGGNNNEAELLQNAYVNSLKLAIENSCRSIMFPTISTGAYGYPKQEAANLSVKTIKEFLHQHPDLSVTICCFDNENYECVISALQR